MIIMFIDSNIPSSVLSTWKVWTNVTFPMILWGNYIIVSTLQGELAASEKLSETIGVRSYHQWMVELGFEPTQPVSWL